jgi:hypothetical protein
MSGTPALKAVSPASCRASTMPPFVAQVRAVDAAEARHHTGQGHHLVGGRGEGGFVKQAGGHAGGAAFHALFQQRAHGRHFVGRGRARQVVHAGKTQGRVADEQRDVDGRLRRDHRALVGVDRIKAERVGAQQVQRRLGLLHHKGRQRDAAVAGHHRGDALRDLGQHLGVVEHDGVVVRVHVDKTRRDRHARAVDAFHVALRQAFGQLAPEARAHGRDAVAHQQHVAGQPAAPVPSITRPFSSSVARVI